MNNKSIITFELIRVYNEQKQCYELIVANKKNNKGLTNE